MLRASRDVFTREMDGWVEGWMGESMDGWAKARW